MVSIRLETDKKKIISYILSTQTQDGGFVFYKVPPSSGLDTFYAVASLICLGAEVPNKEKVIGFIENQNSSNDLISLYIRIKIFNLLNKAIGGLKNSASSRIQNIINQFIEGKKQIYEETVSELESVSRAVELSRIFNIAVQKEALVQSILRWQKNSGGFGKNKANIIDTYFALNTLSQTGALTKELSMTIRYLNNQKFYDFSNTRYLDEVYYLIRSLNIVKQPIKYKERFLNFISKCQKKGGFARNYPHAIPTLEYTYMAVTCLMAIGE